MKDRWLNLSLREKQVLIAGGVIVILFLLYTLTWSPLINNNNRLRTRIQHSQNTLRWMQNADQHIQHLLESAQKKNHSFTGSVLSILQTEINKSELAPYVTQLQQVENDSVQFNLRKVSFDQLIIFLTSLWEKYHVIVSQITVTPTGAPGEVNADVIVQ